MRRTFAVLFTVAPFVAGAVAALSVRHDVRMAAMAAAATVVVRFVTAAMPTSRMNLVAGVGFALASVAAAAVAVGSGARAVFGVVAVAVVLAGFATVGVVLGRRSRQQ